MVLQSSKKLHHSWSGEREIGLAKELFIRDREFAFFGNNGSWKEQRKQRLPLCKVRVHYTTHVDILKVDTLLQRKLIQGLNRTPSTNLCLIIENFVVFRLQADPGLKISRWFWSDAMVQQIPEISRHQKGGLMLEFSSCFQCASKEMVP